MDDSNGVFLLSETTAKPGEEDRLRDLLISTVTGSRSDPGNISYEVHEVESNPGQFIIYEQWVSQKSLESHLQLPSVQQLIERFSELVQEDLMSSVKRLTSLRPTR